MNKKIITAVALCGMVAGLAQAANIRFHGNGSWDMLEGVGQAEGWQGSTPGTNDTARANWGGDAGNVVTLNYAAATINHFQLGVGESGEFHIQNGGVLTTLSDSKIGNNASTSNRTGTLTIDTGGTVNIGSWLGLGHGTMGVATVSGELNTSSHLWMGGTSGIYSEGHLTVEDGGVVNVGGNIALGAISGGGADMGTAFVTVNSGGMLNLHHWDNTGSIRTGSLMTVNDGGSIVVGGNRVDAAKDYAGLGLLTSDLGGILATFDGDANETTITAIPEPATLGLLAAFGGGMLFIRRRFRR